MGFRGIAPDENIIQKCAMQFEFIQIPSNGQGNAKEELNKLLRGGRIASRPFRCSDKW